LVKPETVVPGVAGFRPVQEVQGGVGVTVYPVMGDPPFEPAVHVSKAAASPAVAVREPGEPGVVLGVTAEDAMDCPLGPASFVAVTLNV
jgi:hypothetical protein